jgi:hypothetical protein
MEIPIFDIPSGVYEKEPDRLELARLTEEFLQRGGQIRVVAEGVTSGKVKK